jgi:tetratricopeptide (TPR) repeat protein
VEPNNDEAMKWYLQSAENNYSAAQVNVGLSYVRKHDNAETKYEKNQDQAEALKWFRKAAEQNDYLGQGLLASFYEHGWGVTPDVVEADKWFLLSQDNFVRLMGKTTSRYESELVSKIPSNQGELERMMSPSQITEAKHRAGIFCNEFGVDLYKISRFSEAIAAFTQAIGFQPDDAVIYCNRGYANLWIVNFNGAEADFTKALELNPNFAHAQIGLGLARNHRSQ